MEEINAAGAEGCFFKCDVTDEAELQRTIDATLAKYGHIDILINAVGLSNLKLFTEVPFHSISKAIAVTFLAPVSIIQKILPLMIERDQGHIVNISSLSSLLPSLKMYILYASNLSLNL